VTESRHTARLAAAAADLGITVEVTRFPEGTRTAADAAAAIGCDVAQIVKSLVLRSDDGPVVVLTSGANRVDYAKVAAALDTSGVTRADADEARAATGYPIGGTAPLAHPRPLPMLMDADLLSHERVWAAAGTPDTVFPVDPDRLVEATGARVADVRQA
jgi:Cys-tRNA(Pro) deacylase